MPRKIQEIGTGSDSRGRQKVGAYRHFGAGKRSTFLKQYYSQVLRFLPKFQDTQNTSLVSQDLNGAQNIFHPYATRYTKDLGLHFVNLLPTGTASFNRKWPIREVVCVSKLLTLRWCLA